MTIILLTLMLLGGLLLPLGGWAQAAYLTPAPSDFTLLNFRFVSGETLPALRQHYTTAGQPRRAKAGHVTTAVLLVHGITSAGLGLSLVHDTIINGRGDTLSVESQSGISTTFTITLLGA